MLKALWSRISRWRWSLLAALGVVTFGALAAMGLVRRRDREKPLMDPRKAVDLVNEAVEQERQAGEASRARALQKAEDAEWERRKAEIEAQRVRHLPPTAREDELRRTKDRLRKSGPAIVLLGCLLTASGVRAAEPMEHPKTLAAGWWMDDNEHAETAAWLTELADLRDAYRALKASNVSYQTAAQHDAAQVALSLSVLRACTAQLDQATAEREVLQEDADRWYRRPAVLLGTGFGAGVVLVTAIVLGVR